MPVCAQAWAPQRVVILPCSSISSWVSLYCQRGPAEGGDGGGRDGPRCKRTACRGRQTGSVSIAARAETGRTETEAQRATYMAEAVPLRARLRVARKDLVVRAGRQLLDLVVKVLAAEHGGARDVEREAVLSGLSVDCDGSRVPHSGSSTHFSGTTCPSSTLRAALAMRAGVSRLRRPCCPLATRHGRTGRRGRITSSFAPQNQAASLGAPGIDGRSARLGRFSALGSSSMVR